MRGKKQVLFLCSNLDIGGFQRSLVSLLQCFDYEKYDVDLMLFSPGGMLERYLAEEVHLVDPPITPEYYSSFSRCMVQLLKRGHVVQSFFRTVGAFISLFDKGLGFVVANKIISAPEKHYDVAIDYNGQQMLYYMVDKVDADKRITYFHSDYAKWPYYEKTDRKYFRKVDAIVTVSDECVSSLKSVFPEYDEKIVKIENIISPRTVIAEENEVAFADGFFGTRLVSVSRICMNKGVDIVIEAAHMLREKDIDFRWHWVGSVQDDAEDYIEKIKEYGLEDVLIIMPPVANPYGYMKRADILVQASRFEGKSVTIEEAKVLNIPIVATNYSTVHDQIIDGETGLIVDMNAETVAEGIERLINDEGLREHIRSVQGRICAGNEQEVKKLEKLLDIC